MSDQKWRLSIHKAAKSEMDDLRYNYPAAFEALLCMLDYLAEQRNPAQVNHPDISVERLRRDAKGWLRLKNKCNHVQWRFILRQLQSSHGEPVREILCDVELDDNAQLKVLQIVMVCNRDNHTYRKARARQDAVHYRQENVQ